MCISATVFRGAGGNELAVLVGDSSLVWIVDAASGVAVGRVAASGIPRSVRVDGTNLEVVSREGWLERFAIPF